MAAYFYTVPNSTTSVFRGGQSIHNGVQITFLENLINMQDRLIVSEVTIQNRDTIQYFLTFNDLVSYFYFGKGLGTMSISGTIVGNCGDENGFHTNFPGVASLMAKLGKEVRGKPVDITFGGYRFTCMLSTYTFRASSDDATINTIDFNLQMEIIDHEIPSPNFDTACYAL